MKNNYTVPVKMSEDMLRRLMVICKAEGRTPSSQFIYMLRNNIAYFEKVHGRITPEEINNAGTGGFDISDQN